MPYSSLFKYLTKLNNQVESIIFLKVKQINYLKISYFYFEFINKYLKLIYTHEY